MVEDGLTDLDQILKERITPLTPDRDVAKAALERIKSRSTASKIDPKLIERFERAMRENITTDGIPFRKAYIQAVVDRIEVDDHAIRIFGDKATLEQVIAASSCHCRRMFAVLYGKGAPLGIKFQTLMLLKYWHNVESATGLTETPR